MDDIIRFGFILAIYVIVFNVFTFYVDDSFVGAIYYHIVATLYAVLIGSLMGACIYFKKKYEW
jgi:hypothetical protein